MCKLRLTGSRREEEEEANLEERIKKEQESLDNLLRSSETGGIKVEVLEENIKDLKLIFDYEESRNQRVESKAMAIFGAAGLITAFVFGLSGLFRQGTNDLNRVVLTIVVIALILSLMFLVLTISYSLRVLRIRTYAYPGSLDEVFGRLSLDTAETLAERFRGFLLSIKRNELNNNKKVDYFNKAKSYFVFAIFLLILSAAVMIDFMIFRVWK